ncbi:MAG: SpoIIE family protein phosphatase [Frankiaceae bacterium]
MGAVGDAARAGAAVWRAFGAERAGPRPPSSPENGLLGWWPPEAPVLDALDVGVIVTDTDGVVVYANAAAENMYGHPLPALLGANVKELLVAETDRPQADDIMRQVVGGSPWSGDFEVTRADGSVRTVRITDSPIYKDGVVVGVVGLAQDVTAARAGRRHADRIGARLTQLAWVSAALAAAHDVDGVVTAVVDHAASALGATVSSLSLLNGPDTLVLVGIRGVHSEVGKQWASYPVDALLPASEAVRTGRVVVVANRDEMEAWYPALTGQMPEDRATICLPLAVGDRPLGVISLSFADARVPDEPEMEFLAALADTSAQALDRLAALDEAGRSADQLAFLADASVELAGSVDFTRTLNNVARLVVPRLADWCVVHVVDGDGYRPVAVAHVDPAKVAWARRLGDRYLVDPQAPSGVPQVVATGRSELYPDIGGDLLVARARDEEHLRLLRELGVRSAVIVPLTGTTGTFGALTMIAAESGRRFAEDDRRLAEDLARRAAFAVETAEAFRAQSGRLAAVSRVAEAAQRAILAPAPARVGKVALAARYVSAFAEAQIGGDLYGVVPRPGAIRLIVADVRGKGLEAVRTATVVLGEFRGAAADLDDLTAVAEQIDRRLAPYLGEEDFVTAVLAEIADDGSLTVANCGHPAAVIATRDGAVYEVGRPGSLPLGLGTRPSMFTARLSAGDRVLLYTDGITEARDLDGRFIDLAGVLGAATGGSPDEALDRILENLYRQAGHELTDDLALLIAELRPGRD